MTAPRGPEARASALLPAAPGWTIPDGTPTLPNGMPQTMTTVVDGSWTRKYNIRGKDGH